MTWTIKSLLRQAGNALPGATRGRRGQDFPELRGDANSPIRRDYVVLRDRSRALAVANPYGGRALQLLGNHLVGAGFTCTPHSNDRAKRDMMAKVWDDWASDPGQCDHAGQHTFAGLQWLIMRTVMESGECLVKRVAVTGQRVPFRLQVLEPDFLDTTKESIDGYQDGVRTIDRVGLRITDGRVVGYWLYDRHPGDQLRGSGVLSRYHPAEEVFHVYRKDRPGQVRGFPWCTPLLLKLKDFDDGMDSEQVRQKMSSAYVATITDIDGDRLTSELDVDQDLTPGTVGVLPPGRDIKWNSPPQAPNLESYTTVMLRQIAAGYSVSYEGLTGDYSKVNFSSARMSGNEFSATIEAWRSTVVRPMMLDKVWRWFTQAMDIRGPVSCDWTAPQRMMVDPQKESAALIAMIRAGLVSWPEAVRRLGGKPEALLEEIANTNARLDELGIILDSDGRQAAFGNRSGEDVEMVDMEEDDG